MALNAWIANRFTALAKAAGAGIARLESAMRAPEGPLGTATATPEGERNDQAAAIQHSASSNWEAEDRAIKVYRDVMRATHGRNLTALKIASKKAVDTVGKGVFDNSLVPFECEDLMRFTPLMAAAFMGDAELVEFLIPLSRVRQRSAFGESALNLAVQNKNIACVRILIPASDVSQIDRAGRTALSIAASMGHEELVAMLAPESGAHARGIALEVALRISKTDAAPEAWNVVDRIASVSDLALCQAVWRSSRFPERLPRCEARMDAAALESVVSAASAAVVEARSREIVAGAGLDAARKVVRL